MNEVAQTVENRELVRQIAAMGESHGRALEDLFVENLKTARLLCPIELANGRRGTDGVMQWDRSEERRVGKEC